MNWALFGAWAGVTALLVWMFASLTREKPAWACQSCDFDLRSTAVVRARCPECGAQRDGFTRLEARRRQREAMIGLAVIVWVWLGWICLA
ncbi:MAG: hypothetical protein Tsb0013_07080 [Phycisphaerales bacterium]